ncbi:hypothetical protein PGTUg99_027410 [Puccinia graminis f. sp. tritici]|nr:hypothetical protein PGTUg99_027410 [Puccinia graminis f. sp. tritici]
MDDAVVGYTLAALDPLPPQIRQLFAGQFETLEIVLHELVRNPLRDGLDDNQYEQFLGPFSPSINEAFASLEESLKKPLREWYSFWRSWVRHVHKSRRASFESRQTRVHQLLDSLTISNATAADAATEGEALECKICQEDIVQAGQTILQLPCHPTHLFHLDCIQPWLESHSTCPTCRAEIELPPLQEPPT